MYARIIQMTGRPETADEAIKLWREVVLPAARQRPGFRNVHLFVDRSTGKAISLSLWDTEEDMLGGEVNGYLHGILSQLEGWVTEAPLVEHYDMVVRG